LKIASFQALYKVQNSFQVPPAEIELLLTTHPKIRDAGVIGIPDRRTGEKALAFVVRQAGMDLRKQDVFDFVADNLSKPKLLYGGVQFVREIPRNANGKIIRSELKMLLNVGE
jgi:4-coumarate--CoA ligase